MSVEFGYSRRSWGNFTFTDNRAVGPADFDQYRFTVPTQPELAHERPDVELPAC